MALLINYEMKLLILSEFGDLFYFREMTHKFIEILKSRQIVKKMLFNYYCFH